MPQLDISTFSGHQQTVTLDKRQALSIGAHPSNDIQVEGDDVEIMHCRISWNKRGFEVVSAGSDGVDVNGTLVQKAVLAPGDVLRVGATDITYSDENGESVPAAAREAQAEPSVFSLKPLTDEFDLPLTAPSPRKAAPPPVDDDEPLSAEEILPAEAAPVGKKSSREQRERTDEEQQQRQKERRQKKKEDRGPALRSL